ncbi:zinc finger protein 99-like [Anoplophora glabripennis]|uniref:zinc finger protein 99-like n=1 Tax=Anoplophora glabripennis TaxID=217634 RepID=UPI000873B5CC|nr:zinc finger protein 99-like [Anoplophora glabripennis]
MQPENLKETYCSLCVNIIKDIDTNCQVEGEVIANVLEVVLPNLNSEKTNKHCMCKECSVKLSAAFNFKSMCMNTENIIFPYINTSRMSVVDLKEVYLKEKGNIQLTNISEVQRICRLCFQLVTYEFVTLKEVDVDIINMYIPRVNFSATKDPVICGPCFDSLCTYGSFLRNCLDAQEIYKSIKQCYIKTEEIELTLEQDDRDAQEKNKIIEIKLEKYSSYDKEKYKSVNNQVYIKSKEIEIKLEDDLAAQEKCVNVDKQFYIKTEELGVKLEGDQDAQEKYANLDKQFHIKTEEIEIKLEEDDQNSNSSSYNLDSERVEHKNGCSVENIGEQGFSDNLPTSVVVHNVQLPSGTSHLYQCDKCKYKTKLEGHLKRHQLMHEKVETYKCNTCDFETDYREILKKHQSVIHKDFSKIMFKCDTCSYVSKYTSHLKVHKLTHKDLSEIQMYKCDTCTYETKYKSNLKTHQLLHKDSSEVQMYKCDTCSFETKHKDKLKRHQLLHKNTSETQMYKCDACPYETKQKRYLKDHQLTHKDLSEITLYKCDRCNYETKRKRCLKLHKLTHKDSAKTGFKKNLILYQLLHKDQ